MGSIESYGGLFRLRGLAVREGPGTEGLPWETKGAVATGGKGQGPAEPPGHILVLEPRVPSSHTHLFPSRQGPDLYPAVIPQRVAAL